MVGWTIVMIGIMLIGAVVVFKRKQRRASHIAYWQQQREIDERKGEAAPRNDPLTPNDALTPSSVCVSSSPSGFHLPKVRH